MDGAQSLHAGPLIFLLPGHAVAEQCGMVLALPVQNASPMHVVQAQHHLDEKAPDGVLRQRAIDLVDQVMKRASRGKLRHNVQPALQGDRSG